MTSTHWPSRWRSMYAPPEYLAVQPSRVAVIVFMVLDSFPMVGPDVEPGRCWWWGLVDYGPGDGLAGLLDVCAAAAVVLGVVGDLGDGLERHCDGLAEGF